MKPGVPEQTHILELPRFGRVSLQLTIHAAEIEGYLDTPDGLRRRELRLVSRWLMKKIRPFEKDPRPMVMRSNRGGEPLCIGAAINGTVRTIHFQ